MQILYKSKTFWAGALMMAGAVVDIYFNRAITTADTTAFLSGLGLIGLRQAIESKK